VPASFGTDFGSPDQARWLAGVFTAADFSNPAAGAFANQLRNAFRGPGYKRFDISLFKNFNVPGTAGLQGAKLQIRLEAFNAGNWVNLGNPNGSVTAGTFGRVTSARAPRTLQLGVKYIF